MITITLLQCLLFQHDVITLCKDTFKNVIKKNTIEFIAFLNVKTDFYTTIIRNYDESWRGTGFE